MLPQVGDPTRLELRRSTAGVLGQGEPGLRVGERSQHPRRLQCPRWVVGGIFRVRERSLAVLIPPWGRSHWQSHPSGFGDMVLLQTWCPVIQGGTGRCQGPQKCLESWVHSSWRTLSPADGSSRTAVPSLPWGDVLT